MIKHLVFLLLTVNIIPVLAQDQQKNIQMLSDNFESNTLANWNLLHDTEKWPNKIKALAIENGSLTIEPGTSGWFADKNAPFIYKIISGDFDVRARMKATGLTNEISETNWSLGGLMVRVSKDHTKDQWKPNMENWLFITTGVAEESSKQVIETKYTLNSRSNLKLRDAKTGWITMRIVRVGNSFIMLYKYDNYEHWIVHDRFYLADWPMELQVGFNAYTNSMAVPAPILWGDPFKFNNQEFDHLGKVDFRLTIDYITFQKPRINFDINGNSMATWLNQVSKNNLVDYSISNEEILKILGD